MASSDASRYDLTSELGKHLDRHLVFPLLEFLQMRKVYPEGEILEAKIELLSKTNMIDSTPLCVAGVAFNERVAGVALNERHGNQAFRAWSK